MQAENPAIWEKPAEMQKLNQEKSLLEKAVGEYDSFSSRLSDAQVLLEMAIEAADEDSFSEVKSEVTALEKLGQDLEIKRVLSGELDGNSTYLSINSGAGGQHVNKTDSAVRMYHLPTGIVVSCQIERSQIQNREKAMKMLKARLYEREIERQNAERDAMNSVKKANEWGSQIRSYVMHPYQLVKDHRTDFETNQVQDIMDGDLDDFIMAYLKDQITSTQAPS